MQDLYQGGAMPPLRCTRQGEVAFLCDVGAGTVLSLALQRRVWAVAARLSDCGDVREVVPGMNNFLVIFREGQPDAAACAARLSACWAQVDDAPPAGREIVVPVVYGGEGGEDLGWVAAQVGMTPRDYAEAHAAGEYPVYALGSQPGFAYLGGLAPRLAVGRRATPRPRVEAGAVIIGGAQAGVLSRTSPSGWHIIGRTHLACFDPARPSPALFAPGDVVRFVVQEYLG